MKKNKKLIKDKTRNNNFARAVEWLITNGVVKNQKNMAERMGTTPNTISRNKHGSVARPDDDTLRKFNEQFGSIINIDYLHGESKVMLVKNLVSSSSAKQTGSLPDTTALLLAAKDEIIAGLKRELAAKDKTIESQDALIRTLQQQIENSIDYDNESFLKYRNNEHKK